MNTVATLNCYQMKQQHARDVAIPGLKVVGHATAGATQKKRILTRIMMKKQEKTPQACVYLRRNWPKLLPDEKQELLAEMQRIARIEGSSPDG